MEPSTAIEIESFRLIELRKYNILDTLTEKDYDDITFMASLICDVPIALISFVDEDRQWFKSHKGIDSSETPLEYSFCAHALKSPNEPLIVPDSRKDDRFKTNPLVTGNPNIVFYAGVPLINENGFGLGTVCVIDTKPRELSEKQLAGLQVLSSQVMNLLSMRKTNANLQISQLQIESRNQELIEASKKLAASEAQLRLVSEGQKLFNSELEKQVAERTAELEDKNVDLERMNNELQSFAYISSHDLQEPLRKIQAFSWRIMEKEQEGLSEKAKDYFTRIQHAAKRMQILINDLLSYSSTNTAERVFEHINLSDIINEVKEDLKEEIEAKQASIEASGMCEINIIPFQFRQLLQNLFTNSLKFSRPEKPPVITISSKIAFGKNIHNKRLSAEIEYCHISFSDNGIGFEPVYAERVFELFQRLNGTSEYKGTGIGLAIVKKIVENHNGTITAESELGKGATFNIYLPLQKIS